MQDERLGSWGKYYGPSRPGSAHDTRVNRISKISTLTLLYRNLCDCFIELDRRNSFREISSHKKEIPPSHVPGERIRVVNFEKLTLLP